MSKENIEGACNCVCKVSCHPYRQKLQGEMRDGNKSKVEDCRFYKYLIEHYKVLERK